MMISYQDSYFVQELLVELYTIVKGAKMKLHAPCNSQQMPSYKMSRTLANLTSCQINPNMLKEALVDQR